MLPSQEAARIKALLESLPIETQAQVAALSRKLMALGFPAQFVKIVEGPIVRTFYFSPIGEVKYSNVLSKDEELAGSVSAESVRVERVLRDVAISVPRVDRQLIKFDACLHTMLTSGETATMALPLLMGQNTEGTHLYADLATQPHLLIAGATGSGKSVATAQLICSLALFRAPQELEFILVDTKKLDLVLFKGLEHVKHVIDNVDDLRAVLVMLLQEVRLRNDQMSGLARNISEWNKTYASLKDSYMKYKILIIDELADVMGLDEASMKGLKKNERPPMIAELLQQISQIARAAGIHLILATQRPSVEVIPGDLKTNFPARMAFKLPTKTDSRVILDENGAESLLGRGDFLYKIAGSDIIKRAHSAFVSTTDIAMILSQNEMIRRQYAQI